MLMQTWLVGKWLSPREQRWAAPRTHFYQFVVPPIIRFRRDCTYGKLPAMRLPKDVGSVGSCEVTTSTSRTSLVSLPSDPYMSLHTEGATND